MTLSGCVSEENLSASSSPPPIASNAVKPSGKQLFWTTFETGQNVKTLALEKNALWMGLPNGLIKYNTKTQDSHEVFTIESTHGGLLARGVYKIKIDPHGNKWIATYGGGLSKFDGKRWTSFTPYGSGPTTYGPQWLKYAPGEGLGDLWVYDMVFGPKKEEVWVATWKGVSRFDGKRFITYSEEAGLADKWVYSIAWEEGKILWLGTEGGVSRFDGVSWKNYTHKDGLGADPSRLEGANLFQSQNTHHARSHKRVGEPNPNYVIAIAVDHKNTKWFGTWGSGLSRFDGVAWKTYTTKEGLGGNFIHALLVDDDGTLWAGTDGGVSWLKNNQWHTLTKQDGLVDNNVFSLAFDGDIKWIGTWRGLSRLQMK